ncbi:MAG: hypothetical protein EOO89_32880, partial [Pedobacter sp.]
MSITNSGNVGIGTDQPNVDAALHLHVQNEKGFLVTGSTNGFNTYPDLGAGSRMMFYPGKGAFRAGMVTGTGWNNASVGLYSVGMGLNTTASGGYSTALGSSTIASGPIS